MEQYNELYHYGVKGMKWGIRRYQNENGTLTPAGKKKAKQEYKRDNEFAYELGKRATIYGHATVKSAKRTEKLGNKLYKQLEKDPNRSKRKTQKLQEKLDASKKTGLELAETYNRYKNTAEVHCKVLMKKYGKEAVSSIKYTDKKISGGKDPHKLTVMNEKTNTLSDYATAGVMTLTSAAISAMMGARVSLIYTPTSTGGKARRVESLAYEANREAQKRK